MDNFLDAFQIKILLGLLILLGAMLWYIYGQKKEDRPIRMPRELISRDSDVNDPFRNRGIMKSKLDDLGRHNVRANQADGIWKWWHFWTWF